MGMTVKKDKTDPFYNGDDDIENSSVGGGSTTLGAVSDGDDTDEIAAVQKFSEKDTRRIRAWRYVIAATLLVTALAVTLTTYQLLRGEQKAAFEAAVSKIAMWLMVTPAGPFPTYRPLNNSTNLPPLSLYLQFAYNCIRLV